MQSAKFLPKKEKEKENRKTKKEGGWEAGKIQNPTPLINQLFSFTMVIFRLQNAFTGKEQLWN